MKKLLKSLLPAPAYDLLRKQGRAFRQQQYFKQSSVRITCGAFDIEAPENHALIGLLKSQPYRDLCVGMAAKEFSAKYPEGVFVDIGANIGDTAALMASHAPNKLILIEASDYFFEYLTRNAKLWPNETILKKVFVSDGSEISGRLHHWGGTAAFEVEEDGKRTDTERLADVADEKTAFLKVDTDGFDFKILRASLPWLKATTPGILFESQFSTAEGLAEATALCASLGEIGYCYFIVWDDAGFHVVSTTSQDILGDLHRYLFKISRHGASQPICNFDVLCLHQKDQDIYEKLTSWWRAC